MKQSASEYYEEDNKLEQYLTTPMNEWGFIIYETLVALVKSATINIFKQQCGLVFPLIIARR